MVTEDDEPYLGVPVPRDQVRPYLEALRSYLNQADYRLYTDNQQIRDRGTYHITFINPREYMAIPPSILEGLVGKGGSVAMLGIGVAESPGDRAFFVVCESPHLQSLRGQAGLAESDLHVTLGFNPADMHDVRKDRGTLISDPLRIR
jgi:hypothetical protein